jgi:hypothetical protein
MGGSDLDAAEPCQAISPGLYNGSACINNIIHHEDSTFLVVAEDALQWPR